MFKQKFISTSVVLLCLQLAVLQKLPAQQYDCIFKEPLLTIDFGTGRNIDDINQSSLPKYRRVYNMCPIDGHYSFVSYTSGCFQDDWLTFNEDHTLNDEDGNMMLVNANPTGGVFFTTTITGLKGNTVYQLAAWMINVCNLEDNCPPLPPNIIIKLTTITGKTIAIFQTGLLRQGNTVIWKKYSDIFTTPAGVTTLLLTMDDITIGGCGNDFALDDITIRECIKQLPVTKTQAKPPSKTIKKQTTTTAKKPSVKKIPEKPPSAKKDSAVIITKKEGTDTPEIAKPKKESYTASSLPTPLLKRENPLIKRIVTAAGSINIDLYDNGQIDGDTVSIYHNNKLIVSRAALSAKPISLHLEVDAAHPHHELIMVANNLGSIPPNTSLMIIKANNKRYEVFISSSEQKNAKMVIDLEE